MTFEAVHSFDRLQFWTHRQNTADYRKGVTVLNNGYANRSNPIECPPALDHFVVYHLSARLFICVYYIYLHMFALFIIATVHRGVELSILGTVSCQFDKPARLTQFQLSETISRGKSRSYLYFNIH